MITIQKIGKLLMVFLIVAGMAACNDDDDNAPFEVFGEAVTLKKMVNDTVSYAVAYYAYGNYNMSSAKVKLTSGDSITLAAVEGYKQTFYKVPDSTEYSKVTPTEGTFTFTVVNEGITYTATDKLEVKDFDIPTITETTLGTTNNTATIEWDKLTNADAYRIQLTDNDGKVIFATKLLANTAVKYVIGASNGFTEQFKSGKTYTVELQAYLFEDTATNSNYWYNYEMISTASKSFVWE